MVNNGFNKSINIKQPHKQMDSGNIDNSNHNTRAITKMKINGDFKPNHQKEQNGQDPKDIKPKIKNERTSADVTLNNVTQPNKIGILSSGGLSNQILIKMQQHYPDLFSNATFQTSYTTFEFSEQTKNEIESNRKTELESEKHIDEKYTYPGNKNYDEGNANIIKRQTDLFYYSGTIDSKKKTPKLPKKLQDEVIIDESKHPTFKERAIHIFNELKKKLGLSKEQDSIKENTSRNTAGLDPVEIQRDTNKSDTDLYDQELYSLQDHEAEMAETKEIDDQQYKLRQYIYDLIEDKDAIFIISYLDDENDIKNTFEIVELAKKFDIFSIILTCLPRYFGKVENVRLTNKTLQRLRLNADMVILLPYFDRLDFQSIPDLIMEIMEIITEPGLINIDLADFKMVVKGGNIGVITFGTGGRTRRVSEALEKVLTSKLLNVELGGVNKILINITGGSDMTISEVEIIAEQLKNRIQPGARLILGARINNELIDNIKIFIMLGVKPMQVLVNRYANE